ncbi:protein FAM187B [Tachyglossus aculeatus]|uniref:protein FAM187B n=1 Tax=Tachyglossus aculeatus TaxID=9261 RepID=UPI0018F4CA85|nr:protein FAM187B [Tachyglossus aculeatus]
MDATAPLLLLPLVWGSHGSWSSPCPGNGEPCRLAFVSHNPAALPCAAPGAAWAFLPLGPGPRTPWGLLPPGASVAASGALHLDRPPPNASGLYRCRDQDGHTRALYEVDFQPAEALRLSHAGLGQRALGPEPGVAGSRGGAALLTRWGPWQPCGLCGAPAERKRLGLCFALLPLGGPQPCGLAKLPGPGRGPELRIETCWEPCDAAGPGPTVGPLLVSGRYEVPEGGGAIWLTCPSGSIYRPVAWLGESRALTWLEQLRPNASDPLGPVLEPATGGSRIRVSSPGLYRCFVDQRLVGRFVLARPGPPPPDPPELRRAQAAVQALLAASGAALLALLALSAGAACGGGGGPHRK